MEKERGNTAAQVRILCKSDLCRVFGYYNHKSNQANTRQLRKMVFTNEVLADLKISPAQYRRIKSFTAYQSRRIKEYFEITEDELTS